MADPVVDDLRRRVDRHCMLIGKLESTLRAARDVLTNPQGSIADYRRVTAEIDLRLEDIEAAFPATKTER